jgi:two-component system, response regulator
VDANNKAIVILMADDDEDDRLLAKEAFDEVKLINDFRVVKDGEELLEYLRHEGQYSDPETSPRPGLVLLDLNMPRKDGREVLRDIKRDPTLRNIPVVVLTTSKAEEDIFRTYDLGVNSFITKPVTFAQLVEIMRMLSEYWLHVVELPAN